MTNILSPMINLCRLLLELSSFICNIPVLLSFELQKFNWYFVELLEFNYKVFLASNKIVVNKKNVEIFRFKVKILLYNTQGVSFTVVSNNLSCEK